MQKKVFKKNQNKNFNPLSYWCKFLKVLEKSQKDLQRQTTSLMKLASSFDEEIDRSLISLGDTFKQLRNLLEIREAKLKLEVDRMRKQGSM